jgi:4-amino-4-deoxy-L-arabinose transferase-like glycosyltransferase
MTETGKEKKLIWCAIIFAAALLLRCTHVYFIFRNSPFFDILPGDLGSYDRWATKIVNDGWIGKEIFYQDPLYSYFLALIYKTIGRDFLWVYGIQALLGSVTAVLIYLIGQRTFGRVAGITGGLLYSFYAPAIYFDGLLLKVSLSAFLITASLYYLLKDPFDRPRACLLISGIFLALTVLTRGNFFILLPVMLFVIAFNSKASFKNKLGMAGLYLIGFIMIIAPVSVRNYVVGDDWVLTTAQAGQNFYTGQNPHATGTYTALPFVRPDPVFEQEDFHREAERRLERELKPSEVSEYWFRQGIAFIGENPKRFIQLTGKKLLLFLNSYEIADNHNFYFHKRFSMVPGLSPVTFGLVGPFFILGCITMLRERRAPTVILLLTQVIYILSVILFYVFSRYRVPIMPLFCLTAGFAITDLLRQVTQRQWKPVAVKAAVAFGAFILVTHQVIKPFDFSHSFVDEGIAYEMKGDFEQAARSYEDSVQVNSVYIRAHERLASVQMRLGRFQDAKATYEQLLLLKPESREARVQLKFIKKIEQGR